MQEDVESDVPSLAMPCLFTVHQLLQTEPELTAEGEQVTSNVYVVRPQALWEAMVTRRFSRVERK